jgi:5-methylcytosine-specific restriction endonuclease McrA
MEPSASLPRPGSPELVEIISNRVGRRIYEELFRAPEGLHIKALKERIPEYADQTHFDRRLRDLDKQFVLERRRSRGWLIYRLARRRDHPREDGNISKTVRAEVLFRDGSRCQMCGANPQQDAETKLQVDHKIPRDWGGTNSEENLWTLCETCNTGKRAFFASVEEHAAEMRAAIHYPEVHRRLGEALRAFGVGNEVPSYVLAIVASAHRYQEDWHRRLRELRELDWDYEVTKRKQGDRIASYYRLTNDGGWPTSGTIREELRRRRDARG